MTDHLEIHDRSWTSHLRRRADGAPLLPPLFVLEQGPAIQLIDLGSPEEGVGPAGHIPGSAFVAPEALDRVFLELPPATWVVLVSGHGRLAADVALAWEQAGNPRVAALEGGLAAWRRQGLRTSRDPHGLTTRLAAVRPVGDASGKLTLEAVRRHIGDPRSVRWIKALTLLSHGRLSCVDGRDERGVIGTPGADAGKFLLVLAALERVRGIELDEVAIRAGLLERFDAFGDFYFHTDLDALATLEEAARADPHLARRTPAAQDHAAWSGFLSDPPPDLREALLEQLARPEHVGCGHLRLMQLYGEEYGVRPALVASFLRAAYRLLWDGAPEIHATVLPGVHREGAVLNVAMAEAVWELSWIPLVSPSCGGTQMFVNHPDVARALRRNVVEFLRRTRGPVSIEDDRVERLQEEVERLARRQLGLTLGHLAKGLPVYTVRYLDQTHFEIEATGTIPG